MPVSKTQPDEGVPPLMWASVNIKGPRADTLWELGDVEEKCQQEEQVEDDNSGKEDLDLMAVKAIHNGPVEGRDETVDDEGEEIRQPHGHMLVLIHLVAEESSADNETNHSEHVESTEGRIAPERVVDPCKYYSIMIIYLKQSFSYVRATLSKAEHSVRVLQTIKEKTKNTFNAHIA